VHVHVRVRISVCAVRVCARGVYSVFVGLCAICQCYFLPPEGQPQLRTRPAGRGGLKASEVVAAIEYVQRVHVEAKVTRVMVRALYKTFVPHY